VPGYIHQSPLFLQLDPDEATLIIFTKYVLGAIAL
jgi:hypothetical protein